MFKVNISDKSGKTYKLEIEGNSLIDKELHDKINGTDVSPDLEGYELEITGASDKSGFTAMKEVSGVGIKKVLLGYGKGMHKKPKGDKKKNTQAGGLRLRKTVRGRAISENINQINMKVVKEGSKKLVDIFAAEKPAEETPAQ